jgi:uncharacterized protein
MPKKKRHFEWDAGNVIHLWESHQVRPFEAEEALKDSHAIQAIDEPHSKFEERFGVIGKTKKGRVLFLVFTFRNSHIRVLHARDTKKKEVKLYEEKIRNT